MSPSPSSSTLVPKTYGFRQVLAHTGVTRSQLQHWTEDGLIQPYTAADGQGTRNAYTFHNLIEVAVCKQLRGLGLAQTALGVVIDGLHRLWTDPTVPLTQPIAW